MAQRLSPGDSVAYFWRRLAVARNWCRASAFARLTARFGETGEMLFEW